LPHRVALYTVRVYPRYRAKAVRPLGNIDTSGTGLAETFQSYFKAGVFTHANDDGTRSVVCETSTLAGNEVQSMFAHGQSGYVAQIVDANKQLRIRQDVDDTQLVRCASLFRLEPNQTMGWWAIHVNNGRSAKSLIHNKLTEMFRNTQDKLTLQIEPWVRGEIFEEAVRQGRVDSVTLSRWERPSDRAASATGKWVQDNDKVAKVELRIKGHERLKNSRLMRFLDGDQTAFGEIIQFEGMTFDEARIEVELENGDKRTVNIEKPDAGHAFTVDLDDGDLDFDAGEPTPDSLLAGLGGVLDRLT
jgi:hypothetical protein